MKNTLLLSGGSSLGAALLRSLAFALAVVGVEWIFFFRSVQHLDFMALRAAQYLAVALFWLTGSWVGLFTCTNIAAMLAPHHPLEPGGNVRNTPGQCPGPAAIVGLATIVGFLLIFRSCVGHCFMALV